MIDLYHNDLSEMKTKEIIKFLDEINDEELLKCKRTISFAFANDAYVQNLLNKIFN